MFRSHSDCPQTDIAPESGTARGGKTHVEVAAAAVELFSCHYWMLGHNKGVSRVKSYSYQINLVPEGEGGYTVLVPLLPACVSYGSTVEEATKNAEEAIQLHLENLAAHKLPIPKGNESVPIFTTLVHVTPSHV